MRIMTRQEDWFYIYFPVMLGIDKYGVAICTMVKQVSAGKWAILSL